MSYDPAKRKLNLRKHGLDLAECEPVFDEPMLTREDDRYAYGEQRLISLGWLKSRWSCWCGRTETMAHT